MEIIINGISRQFENGVTLKYVIDQLKIEQKVMAAAINMEIVKKQQWETTILHDKDKVELLQFVGGG